MRTHFFKYLFAGLLVFAYGASIIGVGKHYCRCEEAAQVVLSAVGHHACKHDRPRQEKSSHCCHATLEAEDVLCAGASGTENISESACCTVQVELLQIDQNVPAFSKVLPTTLFSFCLPLVAFFTNDAPAITPSILTNPPPLFNARHPLFSRVQQWRL